MKFFHIICSAGMLLFYVSCTQPKVTNMNHDQQIKDELTEITSLLQDTAFALSMAKNQEAAYYTAQSQPVPDFLTAADDTATAAKSVKEEKIAINIAGFYALECGIGELMEEKGGTPVEWLKKIEANKLDSTEVLILNRFANATWKAGQPFRDLQRIKRDNFISSVFLPEDEVKKDYHQVVTATGKLLPALKDVADSSKEAQLKKISLLLKDKTFALDIAQHMEAAYYTEQKQPVPTFIKPEEEPAAKKKSVKEEKIATNIAGFYALECAISYLATSQQRVPSDVLRLIVNDSLSKADVKLLERFANATWKAGQPFRGLDRINRETFTCFDLLPAHEVDKDWVQIKAAAKKVLEAIKQ
jgi:hypothetical protein